MSSVVVEPVELRFTRPAGKVLSSNDQAASNWRARRRILGPWRDGIGWAWLMLPPAAKARVRGVPCRVQTTIGFATNQSKDPSNYVATVVKVMVDTLVAQDVWPNDSPEWVSIDEPVCVKDIYVEVRLVPR